MIENHQAMLLTGDGNCLNVGPDRANQLGDGVNKCRPPRRRVLLVAGRIQWRVRTIRPSSDLTRLEVTDLDLCALRRGVDPENCRAHRARFSLSTAA